MIFAQVKHILHAFIMINPCNVLVICGGGCRFNLGFHHMVIVRTIECVTVVKTIKWNVLLMRCSMLMIHRKYKIDICLWLKNVLFYVFFVYLYVALLVGFSYLFHGWLLQSMYSLENSGTAPGSQVIRWSLQVPWYPPHMMLNRKGR